MAAEGIPGNVSGALLPTSDEATRTAAITAVDRRMK